MEDIFLLLRKELNSLKLWFVMEVTSVVLQVSGKQVPILLGTTSKFSEIFRARLKFRR